MTARLESLRTAQEAARGMMYVLVQKGHKWDNGMRPDVTTILRASRPECEAEMASWVAAGQTGLRIKPSPLTALEVSLAKRKALLASF